MTIYQIEDVTAGLPYPDAYGLNFGDQIAGDATGGGPYEAFVERIHGNITPTNPTKAASASLNAINDLGVAVGTWRDSDGLHHPFQVNADNTIADLSSFIGGHQAWAADINNNGIVVGGVEFKNGDISTYRGFVFDGNSRALQLIAPFDGVPNCYASAINNNDDVVGTCFNDDTADYRPLAFTNGTSVPFVDKQGFAFDINDLGHIVCGAQDFISSGGGPGPFLFIDGQIKGIPVNGMPKAINNHDQVVGNAIGVGARSYGFLYEDGLVYDLNTLIPLFTGLNIILAWDINDSGHISAGALDGSFGGHALLLTPPKNTHYQFQPIVAIVATILFGVVQDGGGIEYIGPRPIPVDPWGWLTDKQLELVFAQVTSIINSQLRGDPQTANQVLQELASYKGLVQEARDNKPDKDADIGLHLNIRAADGGPFLGTVDVEFRHQVLSDHREIRRVDGSKTIAVADLVRAPQGLYQITVTPTAVFKPISQFVTIPSSGFARVDVKIDIAER